MADANCAYATRSIIFCGVGLSTPLPEFVLKPSDGGRRDFGKQVLADQRDEVKV